MNWIKNSNSRVLRCNTDSRTDNRKAGSHFRFGEGVFKGSKVNRQFSLGNLQKTLNENQQQVLKNENKIGWRTAVSTQNYDRERHINATPILEVVINEVAKEIGRS